MHKRLSTIVGHLTYDTNLTANVCSQYDTNLSANVCSQNAIDEDVVIVSIARTPIGCFNGVFSSLQAIDLGAIAIKGALEKSKVKVEDINAVYMGNVLQANVGQAPARQAALKAGIPAAVPCTTVNKVCASGMKSIMLAASEIKLGHAKVAIAGGMESMSNVPFYLPQVRQGLRMGDNKVIDGMMKDGLHDPYGNYPMGVIAEKTAETHKITREQQDAYAIESYKRASKAWAEKKFTDEIVPVEVPVRGGKPKIITEDEEYRKIKFEDVPKLRGAFGRGQTVTAANSSTISDGAAAVVLASASYAREHGLKPVAVIRSWADAASIPDEFTIAPSLAIPLALKRAGVTINDIDFFEINEAFSVVAEVNCKILNLPKSKVNVNGGAVSLGHPIGCSGARIVCTLANILEKNSAKLGCAAICNGGGGASALIIQKI